MGARLRLGRIYKPNSSSKDSVMTEKLFFSKYCPNCQNSVHILSHVCHTLQHGQLHGIQSAEWHIYYSMLKGIDFCASVQDFEALYPGIAEQ